MPSFAQNWPTLLSLVAPALHLLRFVRVLRPIETGGLGLMRPGIDPGGGAAEPGHGRLAQEPGPPQVGYVLALTLVVASMGAAGMLQLEGAPPRNGQGFAGYADAPWWTAMLTTVGPQYRPLTPEGRILCVPPSLYSILVVGYLKAAPATFFVGRDVDAEAVEAPRPEALERLCREVVALWASFGPLQRAGAARGRDDAGRAA